MAYKKWVGNENPNDWVSVLRLEDGTEVRLNQSVELNADQVKALEAKGRIFEDSSASEAKEEASDPSVAQPAGADVAGASPVFVNAGESNQDDNDQDDAPKRRRNS